MVRSFSDMAANTAAVQRMHQRIGEWSISSQRSVSLNERIRRINTGLRRWLNYYAASTSLRCDGFLITSRNIYFAGLSGNTVNLCDVRVKPAADSRRWSADSLPCSPVDWLLEKSRSGRWEPYEGRLAPAVVRGTGGQVPRFASTIWLTRSTTPWNTSALAQSSVRLPGGCALAVPSAPRIVCAFLTAHLEPAWGSGRRPNRLNRIYRNANRSGGNLSEQHDVLSRHKPTHLSNIRPPNTWFSDSCHRGTREEC